MKDHEDRRDQIRIDGTPGADGSVTMKTLWKCVSRPPPRGRGPTISLSGAGGPFPDFSFATLFMGP